MEKDVAPNNEPQKKLSLSDIVRAKGVVKPLNTETVEAVTTNDVQVKPKIDPQKAMEQELLAKIDNNIDRVKRSIYNEKIKPMIDEQKAIMEEKEFNGEIEVSNMAEIAAYKAQHKSATTTAVEQVQPTANIAEESKEEEVVEPTPDFTTSSGFLDKPIADIDFDENDFDDDLISDEKDSSDSDLDDGAKEEEDMKATEEDEAES